MECFPGTGGRSGAVFAMAFHPGGTRLATAGREGVVWLWDLATGEAVARLPGHTNYVMSLAFSGRSEENARQGVADH